MSKKEKKVLDAATRKKKIQRRKHIAVTVFSIYMIFVLAIGCVAMKVVYDVDQSMDTMYESVSKIDMRNPQDESSENLEEDAVGSSESLKTNDLIEAAEPIGILLIGTDTGDFGRNEKNGLSDVMIYCVLNPERESLTMLSIPRDTYTEIVGHGTYEKLNASYAYGGAEMTINSIQNLLGVPVDFYAAVNFAGFQKIIDAIGGVTVENAFAFSQDEYYFPEGTLTLDGDDALAFCRMRKKDPEGDFGRGRRQRNVILAMAQKATSLSGALNYQELLEAVSENVLTDIRLDSAIEMISQYGVCLKNVNNMDTLKGYDDYSLGTYLYRLDEENLAQVTAQLRSELGLATE